MNNSPDIWTQAVVVVLYLIVFTIVVGGFVVSAHFILTMPMRRAERARVFLDLIESAIRQGQPVEETLISLAQARDLTMGVRFYILVAWLEEGISLHEALAQMTRFLPPQITAMLEAGRKIGDLKKVLPACRQLLKDAVSQTRGAINYLVILTFVVTPLGIWLASGMKIFVLPKFAEIAEGMGLEEPGAGMAFISNHLGVFVAIQVALLFLLWLGVFSYAGGPRLTAWFPWLQRVQYVIPWRRKRLQRDFSTLLAILLDAGVPEPEALTLAADCAVNTIVRQRAKQAVEGLRRGLTLTQAVQSMDDSGEFAWRMTNAVHGGGFFRALAGWHESLDAKAFQQEQAAAHGITSGLVLWTGVFIGVIVVSVFAFLTSIINMGVLW